MAKIIIDTLAKLKGMSQSRLQREAGVTMPMLRRYWANDTDSVHLESMDKIAHVLEVQVGDLFAREGRTIMAEGIFFKSLEHKKRFVEGMQRIEKIDSGKFDPEYAAALYILTADLATWEKAQEYVGHDSINIPKMLEEVDFSSGHAVLVHWAGNLFNSGVHIDPIEALRLDESNFEVALCALRIRRYGMQLSAFE